jgi:peptide/nickel transport system substrate-binding protein
MSKIRGAVLAGVAVAAGALLLAGYGTASASSAPLSHVSRGVHAVRGGTVTFADSPDNSPNWIFPVLTGATDTVANGDFMSLLYEGLWQANFTQPTINYANSIANAPIWSDGDRVVTFSLKHYIWSNGQPVTTRDVQFFINLVRAAGTSWGSYTAGDFPYNVRAVRLESPTKMSLVLDEPFNPTYYEDTQLAEITPLPQAVWDRESLHGKVGNYDETQAGAKKVEEFLSKYAQQTSTYSSKNPIWGVTDGAYELASFGGNASPDIFVPNPRYSGHRSTIAKFELLPFTSDSAEYNILRSGTSALTLGYIPFTDVPTIHSVEAAGYKVVKTYNWMMNFLVQNMKNPTDGAVIRQLYVRQALQHLIDQPLMVSAFLHGYGAPTYGPVPVYPKGNPYTDAYEAHNLYPYSVSAAKALLSSHGWRIVHGVQTCESETACGKGVKKGTTLNMKVVYPSGQTTFTQEMLLFSSDAAKAGIKLDPTEENIDTVFAVLSPCTPGVGGVTDSSPVCTWQIGGWGGWTYGLFPSGGENFLTGSTDNPSSFSNSEVDKLLIGNRHSSNLNDFHAYENLVSRLLPDLWLPTEDTITAVAHNLRGPGIGAEFNSFTPNWWYFVKA